jgi:hypothetical protein
LHGSTVVTEFKDTITFYDYYTRALRTHREAGRPGTPAVILYSQYQDAHGFFDDDLEAHLTCILNMVRSLRNRSYCRLLDSEMPGSTLFLFKCCFFPLKFLCRRGNDIQNLRADQLAERLALKRGIQIYGQILEQNCAGSTLRCGTAADTMEQYKNISSKSPAE